MRNLLISVALLVAACASPPPPPVEAVLIPGIPNPPPIGAYLAELAAYVPGAYGPVLVPGIPAPPDFTDVLPTIWPKPGPGRLTLNNFSFDRVHVEAVVTASPVCNLRVAGDTASSFELPLNDTRIIVAPPGTDVCWRRQVEPAPGQTGVASDWSDWSRAYVAQGTAVNARL